MHIGFSMHSIFNGWVLTVRQNILFVRLEFVSTNQKKCVRLNVLIICALEKVDSVLQIVF